MFTAKTVTWTKCRPRCTNKSLPLGSCFRLLPSVPSYACFLMWLIAHTSVVVWTKAVLFYYPFNYSTTGTQIQRHSVWLSALPHSFRCVANTCSAPCKQVLFVLSDNKYCFGKMIIIKRRHRVYLSIYRYKTHNCTVCRALHLWFLYFSPFFLFFFLLASALRPKIRSGRGAGEVQVMICVRP